MTIESASNFAIEHLKMQGIQAIKIESKVSCSRYVEFEINDVKRKLRFSDHPVVNGYVKTFCVSNNKKNKRNNNRIPELKRFIDSAVRDCKKRSYYKLLKSTNLSRDKK